MNGKRDLLKRVLHLFPAKILKEYWQESGNNESIIDTISASKSYLDILNFAFDQHNFTRQNIYIYDLNNNFHRASMKQNFPMKIEKEAAIGNEYNFFCLPLTDFSVYLSNPTTKENISFHQPVFITIINKLLIISYTKLEKNVNSYFPLTREPKKAGATNTEDETLKQLIAFFEQDYTVTPTDLNKGIKYLWHIDDIDCHKIQWRNPHSITTETMDGELTFKEKYPQEYLSIIKTRIENSIWKYLIKNDYLCEGFTCNPSLGQISITKFPITPNQVKNVFTKILAHN